VSPYSSKLPHMRASLDKSGPLPLVKALLIIARSRDGQADVCALNEMQKAGIDVEELD
jgi:hypothetical protein